VDETVMNDDIADAEKRHAAARADHRRAREPMKLASDDDERCGERSVEHRQGVVSLEAPGPGLVMRAMHCPERVVPNAAVEEARPRLHEDGDGEPDRDADAELSHERRHEDLRR
jgi:ribosomal protein L32